MHAPPDDPSPTPRSLLLEHMAGCYRTCNQVELAAIDDAVVREQRISLASLIERAGQALASEAHAIAQSLAPEGGSSPPVEFVILAGKGHNGADGLSAAASLHQRGLAVTAFLFAQHSTLDGPSRHHLDRALAQGVNIHQPIARAMDASGSPSRDVHEEMFEALHTLLSRSAIEHGPEARSLVVIDALVGTALSRPLEGVLFQVVMRVNAARNARLSPLRMHVLSADIPSGVSSQSGLIGPCMHADSTLTFVACKPAFGLSDVRTVTGPIRLAKLQIPDDLIDRVLRRA